jgi:RND family efflux transporter MFP subunit
MLLRTRTLATALVAISLLAACGKKEADGAAAASPAASAASATASKAALLVAPEDLLTLALSAHASGPVITGAIQPERRADLRAEIGTLVLQVLKDNGEAVRKGEVLVRLDDTAIRDTLTSAEESARASRQSLDQLERQFQRLKTLQAQGMSSMQALEDAEQRRNNAQSDLVAADARVASARQQRQRTEVRAPFDGLVSDRKISAGDTVQVGRELLKVIDPASMRFEGQVSSDRLAEVKPGQVVQFRVNGQDKADFVGKVRRVDASADATTRQLSVLVDFTGGKAPAVAGLYAEGRIATAGTQALMVAESALAREGDKTYVWRLAGSKLAKVLVQLGERDARRGEVVLVSGVEPGEQILRNPGATLADGQKFELAGPAAGASSVAAEPR